MRFRLTIQFVNNNPSTYEEIYYYIEIKIKTTVFFFYHYVAENLRSIG